MKTTLRRPRPAPSDDRRASGARLRAPRTGRPSATGPAGPAAPARTPAPLLRVESAERLADTADRLRATYRSPTPPTTSHRLAAACLWALALAVLGTGAALAALVVGLGASDGLATALQPLAVGCGLTGLGLTIGAFLTIGRRRTPWVLLGAATAVVVVLLVAVAAA